MPRATNEVVGTWEPGEPQTKSIRAGGILFGEEENIESPRHGCGGIRFPRFPGSPAIPTAADVFHAAAELGIRLSVTGGFIEWEAEHEPPGGFLAAVAAVKPVLIRVLMGDSCRWCGSPLAWPGPVGITFADGTSECMACADAEVERIWRAAERVTQSADARTDPAEALMPGTME
jgi:hypothetical protein